MSSDIKLGDIPLDAQQTLRKAWCDDKDGHRSVQVNVDYNIIEHTYDNCCRITKVEYFHESDAESTKITYVADCCSSLDGKSFNLHTKDDSLRYNIIYSVDCATSKPINTVNVRYILVNIMSCDAPEVVSLATKQSIEADQFGACSFCINNGGGTLTITNAVNGDASDATGNTGFTFEVLTQGTKTSVETLNYFYDDKGRIDKVTNSSGNNKLNVIEQNIIQREMENQNNEKSYAQLCKMNDTSQEVRDELIKLNTYMEIITGEKL